MRSSIIHDIGIGYYNLVITTHISTFNWSPKRKLPNKFSTIFINIYTIAIC